MAVGRRQRGQRRHLRGRQCRNLGRRQRDHFFCGKAPDLRCRQRGDLCGREAELEGELAGLVGLEADAGVDVLLEDLVGGGVGDLFEKQVGAQAGKIAHQECRVRLLCWTKIAFDAQMQLLRS